MPSFKQMSLFKDGPKAGKASNTSGAPKSASINDINDVIHGRLRLGIMAYLSTVSPASFPELQQKTGATNGNLSTHLTKLETAGFIRQKKGYNGKRPQTLVHMTDDGRRAWIDYLDAMRSMLDL